MPPERALPGSPEDWLRFARSDLAVASQVLSGEVLRETLCYHAHQAAEKSIKVILLKHGKTFPKSHNLKVLLESLSSFIAVPDRIMQTTGLTDYSVTGRYPGDWESVTAEEHQEAVRQAKLVYDWAVETLKQS